MKEEEIKFLGKTPKEIAERYSINHMKVKNDMIF